MKGEAMNLKSEVYLVYELTHFWVCKLNDKQNNCYGWHNEEYWVTEYAVINFCLFFWNSYNTLLTSSLNHFPLRHSNILCMGFCQFSYKVLEACPSTTTKKREFIFLVFSFSLTKFSCWLINIYYYISVIYQISYKKL